jgi:hypothetical protein
MTRTGVFADAKEIASIKNAAAMPLIALNAGMPPSPREVAHRIALAHGLPEVSGYYGIDLTTGEFLKA